MTRSVHKIIDEQVKRWEADKRREEPVRNINIITISRECGSRGQDVAEKLAEKTGFDLFDKEILNAMLEESRNSKVLLETLDERSMNIVDDIVSTLVNEHHLWPDEYSKLLMKIMNTIGKHGNAIVLGRGGNCALEKLNPLKVRIVAPVTFRREYIKNKYGFSAEDANKFMVSSDANRNAFVKRYFNSDATDPANYDLILNTGRFSVDKVVQLIQTALKRD